jgi:dolichol-phosphate mannosyltransferase/undecaprenyl-phosphate 4-deoxy-4-formamido-L-arabinose transferase
MIRYLDEHEEIDVVLGRYQNRKHSFFRRLGTAVSSSFTTKMLGKSPDLEMTSFRLMRRFIVDAIRDNTIHLPQIGNLLLMTSNRIVNVDVRHDPRAYGHSGYSFRELTRELFYDISTNSAFPLLIVRNVGIVTFIISIVLGLIFLIQYLIGSTTVTGWTSTILVLLASTGLTLLSIGILGDYMLHVLDESKKMPHYVLRQKDI